VLFCGSDTGWIPGEFVLESQHEVVDEDIVVGAYGIGRIVSCYLNPHLISR
jgi:hypothetical protein